MANDKIIKVPDPISFVDPMTEKVVESAQPWTFQHFVRQVLMNDQCWAKGLEYMRAQSDILAALEAIKDGKCALKVGDWEKLSGIVKNPTAGVYQGINPALVYQIRPFFEAVVNPTE